MGEITLTEQQRRDIYEDESEQYEQVGIYELGMDSHGCLCKIVAFTAKGVPDSLYGFMMRLSSEDVFYDDEEVYKLKAKRVTVTQYEPTNYSGWQW